MNDEDDGSGSPKTPIQELIKTEETYLRDLTLLNECFMIPMREWLKSPDFSSKRSKHADYCIEDIMNQDGTDIVKILFSDLQLILNYNKQLYDDIKLSAVEGHKGIAKQFKDHANFMKMYKTYMENYDNANTLLNRLLNGDARFKAFINAVQLQKQLNGKSLQSLLIVPVQRIPRYSLLLAEMIKRENDSEIKDLLKEAQTSIINVTVSINTALGNVEKRQRLLAIKEDLNMPELIESSNYLMKEGMLNRIVANGKKSLYFVLTTNLFAWAEVSSTIGFAKTYKNPSFIPIPEMNLILLENDTNSFMIRGLDTAFVLEAGSDTECMAWRAAFISVMSAPRIQQPMNIDSSYVRKSFKVYATDGQKSPVLTCYKIKENELSVIGIYDITQIESGDFDDCEQGKGLKSAASFRDDSSDLSSEDSKRGLGLFSVKMRTSQVFNQNGDNSKSVVSPTSISEDKESDTVKANALPSVSQTISTSISTPSKTNEASPSYQSQPPPPYQLPVNQPPSQRPLSVTTTTTVRNSQDRPVSLPSNANISAPLILPEGWVAKQNNKGKVYYVNMITKAVQWDRPT